MKWVKLTANITLYNTIDTLLKDYDTAGSEWYTSTENLKTAIDAYFAANPTDTDKEFYFLLNLDNPVGFDSTGYNSNGSTLHQDFNSLNQGFDMNANISPLEISQIVITFGS